MVKKKAASSSQPNGNAFAAEALELVKRIDDEAKEKKHGALAKLNDALENIRSRMKELAHQEAEIEETISKITGKAPAEARRKRANLSDVKGRLINWLGSHQGEKYSNSQLMEHFPELEGRFISSTFKTEIDEGQIKVDKTGGRRDVKYFVG